MRFVLTALAAGVLMTPAADARHALGSCRGGQLSGRFVVVPGSGAAGSISYRLTLKNASARSCTVAGLPLGRLLDRHKAKLPTHVRPARPGALTSVLVRLAPGRTTFATARFSPDVPGPGEQVPGRCEPRAYWFRVQAPGGGTTTARLVPPTSVCEHGRLFLSAYGTR
ncbi:MAG: DUF4232 domain-containing protein [Thermoleophilia bacterium]|nr:DUF4232 domain-containing protein [Thermoleophilia bacterium]